MREENKKVGDKHGINSKKIVRKELFRIVKCDTTPAWQAWLVRICAVILALLVCAVVINLITHLNPIDVYKSMYKGAFGTGRRLWVTIRDTMALLCVGIALAPAFKMRFWNIGAEGQILVGGLATAACMIYFKDLSAPWLFIVMISASLFAGAVWALIPAIFKARWNTNETLFTLMMNYVAIQLTAIFVAKWENPKGSNSVGIINQREKIGWLTSIFDQQYLITVIIVLSLAILMFIYLKYTKHGYEISVVGESEKTAKYAGISVGRVIIRTMLLSGAIAGLAGFITVSGASHTISVDTAGGRGFTAIIVAWMSKFNTFIMLLVSVLLIFLQKGATQIAADFGLNEYASQMITGIILFFIIGSEFFINYRVIFRAKHIKGE